ncbi:MAG: TonB-dependent receptor [Pseudomonadota bacterium]
MKSLAAVSVSLVALAFAAPAFAQDAAPQSGAVQTADDNGELNEIVVTAQRREENAQDVPISVSTISADLIAQTGIPNPEALGQLLPGVTFNRQSIGVTPYVRGIGGNNAGAGNEPSIALYIDDVYMPTALASVFDFNSVESISVLKGPQGTLFGRNASGGVIQVNTRDPGKDLRFDADLSYANYQKISGALYANVPLSENIAFNIAAHGVNQADGWGRNVLTGKDAGTTDGYGARAKLRFDLGATVVQFGGNYDHRRSDQGGFAANVVPGTFGRGGYNPVALGAGFYDTVNDFGPLGFINKAYQLSAKIEHDAGNVILRSVTAYGNVNSDAISDLEASPLPFNNSVYTQGNRSITQEFQVLSPASAPVKWIIGAFYMHDYAYFSIVNSGTAFGTNLSIAASQQRTDSISGFGQMTAEILPRLNATVGVRYTSDSRRYTSRASLGATISGPFERNSNFQNLTGRAALDYHFSDDVMAYIAYNKGFKSGLYNLAGLAGGAAAPPPVVLPEELNAYTLGIKTELLDRRVRFNVEGYWYDYTNIQLNNVIAGATVVSNAARARIRGVDFELTGKATAHLTLSATVSLADGKYTSYPNAQQFFPLPPSAPIAIPAGCVATTPTYPTGTAPTATRVCDLTGNKTVQTVPFGSTLSATYDLPTSAGDFSFTASWAHGGNYFFEADNNPKVRQPITNIINGSVNWTSTNGRYGLSVWGNNITGQEYYNTVSQSTLSGTKYSPAPPATYGVTARLRF